MDSLNHCTIPNQRSTLSQLNHRHRHQRSLCPHTLLGHIGGYYCAMALLPSGCSGLHGREGFVIAGKYVQPRYYLWVVEGGVMEGCEGEWGAVASWRVRDRWTTSATPGHSKRPPDTPPPKKGPERIPGRGAVGVGRPALAWTSASALREAAGLSSRGRCAGREFGGPAGCPWSGW